MTQIMQIGGCVRDKILGLKPKDIDYVYVDSKCITTDELFESLQQYLKSKNYTIFLETKDCLTIRAKIPNSKETADFVCARKEIKYESDSRKPECVPGTLYDDAERRDFTVNAMAEDEKGEIIDFFNGKKDLENKILDTPISPYQSFGDDPLRLIRAIRFSITYDFTFSDRVNEAFHDPEIWLKLKTTVSIERIQAELTKCFQVNTPKTIRILASLDNINLDILNYIFKDALWLKPTNEKKK